MKHKLLVLLGCLALVSTVAQAAPLGTAFSYQGRLEQNEQPALNGIYQMNVSLFAQELPPGAALVSRSGLLVPVTNGLFTVELDFGSTAFTGEARWLEIAVRTNNNALPFNVLAPRTRVAPTPHALYASTAGTVNNGAIQAGQLATLGAPTANQFLSYDGSSLLWRTPPSGLWQSSGSSAYYDAGNVGIGTASPTVPLHVNSSATVSSVLGALLEPNLVNGGFNQIYLGRSPSGNGCSTFTYTYDTATPANSFLSLGLYNSSYSLNVRGNGYVGIGTTAPTAPLHVNSSATGSSVLGALLEPNQGNGAFSQLFLGRSPVGNGCGTFTYTYDSANPASSLLSLGLYDSSYTLNVRGNGNIGIGTTTPQSRLEIIGQDALRLTGYQPFLTLLDENAGYAQAKIQTADGNFHFTPSGGHATFWATDLWLGHPARRGTPGRALVDLGGELHVNFANDWGRTVIGGSRTSVKVLEITGGADLAEPFPMKEEIEKGSVVVIDDEHPGQLKCSTRAYDTRVAGVISGANGINPGISLKQEGVFDQGQNVALSGRVYVKADASHGTIKPGDLLTTSDTPGHAMKVSDHTKSQGAILGKAMSALKAGTGLVLVLVTLQ